MDLMPLSCRARIKIKEFASAAQVRQLDRFEVRGVSTLERAICIAAQAHAGQQDKAGQPYVLHVLRVMLRFESEPERIVAILHDLLEDTSWTAGDLQREGFSTSVIEAIKALTRRDGEPYDGFIRRAASNQVARRVKLADLEDNMDLRRIANPTPQDWERLVKYKKAHTMLCGETV